MGRTPNGARSGATARGMSELPPKLVRIFISSPSDVAEERKAAAELIEQELAKREAFRKPLKLDAFRYEDLHSDTPFLANRSAQASVDQRLQSADAEIVVAILWADRKSTRLNSSHVKISYAVFCL